VTYLNLIAKLLITIMFFAIPLWYLFQIKEVFRLNNFLTSLLIFIFLPSAVYPVCMTTYWCRFFVSNSVNHDRVIVTAGFFFTASLW